MNKVFTRSEVHAETYTFETGKLATSVITILGILMFIFAKPLTVLYSTDSQVIDLSVRIIRILPYRSYFLV